MWRYLLTLLVVSIVAACGGSEEDEAIVKVFKSRGFLQCTGGGTPPEVMRAELTNAGIVVLSSACGSDGQPHLAACGIGDGAINIFEVSENQAARAQALAFFLLSTLPTAREVPCP